VLLISQIAEWWERRRLRRLPGMIVERQRQANAALVNADAWLQSGNQTPADAYVAQARALERDADDLTAELMEIGARMAARHEAQA